MMTMVNAEICFSLYVGEEIVHNDADEGGDTEEDHKAPQCYEYGTNQLRSLSMPRTDCALMSRQSSRVLMATS